MRKENAVTATVVFFTGAFVLFVLLFERHLHNQEHREITTHSRIIASDLWNLESRGATEYLTLACREHVYDRLQVKSMAGKIFINLESEIDGPLDSYFISAKLIHPSEISADIVFKGKKIGRITATWHCTSIYAYLYILFIMFMAVTLLWYYLRTLEANRELEARVMERTADP